MNRSFLYIAAAALLTAACTKEPREEVLPVTGVTLNPPAALLLVGAMLTLDAVVVPVEAANKNGAPTTIA